MKRRRFTYANCTIADGHGQPSSIAWRAFFRLLPFLPGLHRRTHLFCYGVVASGAFRYAQCSCWKTFGVDPYRKAQL